MEKVVITCPKCGFSKEFPAESIPKVPFRINCPKCKEASVIRPGGTAPAPAAPASQPPKQEAPVPVPPTPEPAPRAPEPEPPAPPVPPAPEPPVPEPVEPEQPAPVAPSVLPEEGMVTIICPGCGFRKEVKAGLVPEGAAITCPQCKERFFFTGGPSGEVKENQTIGMRTEEKEAPSSVKPRPQYPPNKPAGPYTRPPVQAPAAKVGTGGELPGIGELFGGTWEVYKNRFWTLLGLYLASVFSFVLSILIFLGSSLLIAELLPPAKTPLVISGLLAGATVGFFVLSWGFAALLIAVVDEDAEFMEAISMGKAKILSFAWLYTLLPLIIMGGYVLLIIPGIVLSLWFIFAKYILAESNISGLGALIKSKSYVKGHWWGIFFRLFVMGLVSAILGMIPFIGSFLSLAFVPFTFIYLNKNYQALKEIKGDISSEPSARDRQVMVALGVIGSIALVLLFAFVLSTLSKIPGGMDKLQGLIQTGGVKKPVVVVPDQKPRLWLNKNTYAPGEKITVHFTAPASYEDNAWVGIFQADAPHGKEETNDQNKLIFQYLRKRTSGSLVFSGPTRPGSYDLRMNDNDANGNEVATIAFTVAASATQQEQPVPAQPAR